jgi:hypothetical protein
VPLVGNRKVLASLDEVMELEGFRTSLVSAYPAFAAGEFCGICLILFRLF